MTRLRNRRSYLKDIVLIIFILAVSGILSFTLFGPGGYRDLQKARLELYERKVRINRLEYEVETRKKTVEALDEEALKAGRPEALELLEKTARDQDYGREGEYIQRTE